MSTTISSPWGAFLNRIAVILPDWKLSLPQTAIHPNAFAQGIIATHPSKGEIVFIALPNGEITVDASGTKAIEPCQQAEIARMVEGGTEPLLSLQNAGDQLRIFNRIEYLAKFYEAKCDVISPDHPNGLVALIDGDQNACIRLRVGILEGVINLSPDREPIDPLSPDHDLFCMTWSRPESMRESKETAFTLNFLSPAHSVRSGYANNNRFNHSITQTWRGWRNFAAGLNACLHEIRYGHAYERWEFTQ